MLDSDGSGCSGDFQLQLECLTESAWVNWWNQGDSYSDYVCLYSKERQESYKELMDRECSYHEVSPVLSLGEGAVFFLYQILGRNINLHKNLM